MSIITQYVEPIIKQMDDLFDKGYMKYIILGVIMFVVYALLR